MSLELCILASGSSGNCTVLRTPAGAMLIDAGIGPRTTGRRLAGTGVNVSDVTAFCLTHLDRDHFTPHWLTTVRRLGIRIFCHQHIRDDLLAMAADATIATALAELVSCFDGQSFSPMSGVDFHPIPLAHDQRGSHGFLIEGFGQRVGYATDLGRVPDGLISQFEDLDILALESNYDTQMQMDSARPWFLKQRIMGGAGHLSNQQALEAVRQILDRAESRRKPLPSHIVLLHRSRQCNCPDLLRRMFSADRRIAPRLTLAAQYERSEWLRPRPLPPLPGEQLALAWG